MTFYEVEAAWRLRQAPAAPVPNRVHAADVEAGVRRLGALVASLTPEEQAAWAERDGTLTYLRARARLALGWAMANR